MSVAGPSRRHLLDRVPATHFPTSNLPPAIKFLANGVYYPNWRVYRGQAPSSLKFSVISHVFYAFARIGPDGLICLSDEYADTQIEVDGVNGCLRSFAALKKLKDCSHLKVIISVGGGEKGSEPFKHIASDPSSRQRFANSARALVDEYGLDGLDIDWEHPSNSHEGSDYVQLLAVLRTVFPAARYLLTSALPAGQWALQHINLSQAATHLDYINLMAYDFSGTWTSRSGHHSQLYSPQGSETPCGHTGIDYMLQQGVPPSKLLLGIPAYGRSFLGANSPGQPYHSVGGEEGTFEYRDLPRPGTVEQVDPHACAAFCVGGDGGFVTYDNPATVLQKAGYVKARGLGGLFYWTATGDAGEDERSLVYNGYMGMYSQSNIC